jgi:peptidyl-prolyl cis-trans isomerase A (cyclophilin A)
MWDRVWRGTFGRGRADSRRASRPKARRIPNPRWEDLEARALLSTASLASLPDVSAPQFQGSQVPLDGTGGGAAQQTYTVTSSNPDITATVAQGPFLTFTVTHQAASSSDISFTGNITYQLFQDLTPNTVAMIESFINANPNYYVGKDITRVVPGFVFQGGAPNPNGTGSSGLPGTPFNDEFVQQLAFVENNQLAMANTEISNTNDTQWFSTLGITPRLTDLHTIFGQLVAGQDIVNDISKVQTEPNSALNGENSLPVMPITITAATLSNTNPDGVVHLNTTLATAGESSKITVTATDPSSNTTATQSFQVNVGPSQANLAEAGRPFIQPPPNATVAVNQTYTFQPQTTIPFPQDAAPGQLTYTVQGGINQPTGTTPASFINLSNATSTVNNKTGVISITPNSNFTGPINVLVGVQDQFNRGTGAQNDPSNFQFYQFTLNVGPSTSPVQLPPIAIPINPVVNGMAATPIQLASVNPNVGSNQTLTYNLVTQPRHGTISDFNAQNGTLLYTPQPGFSNVDSFQYTVTESGGGQPTLTSNPVTVTLTGTTNAVRTVGRTLVVTPPPVTSSDTISIAQINDPNNSANDILQVAVNGMIDSFQPLVASIDRIIVMGGAKANNTITIDPSVTIPAVSLAGGNGVKIFNVIQGGSTATREHGWYGKNTLIGGSGTNELIGRLGHVRFKPSDATTVMFAGDGNITSNGNGHHKINPPTGTFYKAVKSKSGEERIVPVPTPPLKFIQNTFPESLRGAYAPGLLNARAPKIQALKDRLGNRS